MKQKQRRLRDLLPAAREKFMNECSSITILGGRDYDSDNVSVSVSTSGSASGTFMFEESVQTVMNALSDFRLSFVLGFNRTYRDGEASLILRRIIFQIEFEEKNGSKL